MFGTTKEAAIAYDLAAIEAKRPKSELNFPDYIPPQPLPSPPPRQPSYQVVDISEPTASSPSAASSSSSLSSSLSSLDQRLPPVQRVRTFAAHSDIPDEYFDKSKYLILPVGRRLREPTGAVGGGRDKHGKETAVGTLLVKKRNMNKTLNFMSGNGKGKAGGNIAGYNRRPQPPRASFLKTYKCKPTKQ